MAVIVNGLLVRQGKILLAHRSPTRATYPGTWSFPGGHVEAGESIEAALIREIGEEIGVVPTAWQQLDKFPFRDGPLIFHFFLVTDWQGSPRNFGDEYQELRWVDLEAAGDMPSLTFDVYPKLFIALAGSLLS